MLHRNHLRTHLLNRRLPEPPQKSPEAPQRLPEVRQRLPKALRDSPRLPETPQRLPEAAHRLPEAPPSDVPPKPPSDTHFEVISVKTAENDLLHSQFRVQAELCPELSRWRGRV